LTEENCISEEQLISLQMLPFEKYILDRKG